MKKNHRIKSQKAKNLEFPPLFPLFMTVTGLLFLFGGGKAFSIVKQEINATANQISNSQLTKAEAKSPIGSTYLRVIEGNGKITQSSYPRIIPPERTKSKIDGGSYDPQSRKIQLNIKGRLVEISLKNPLVDNKPIQFTAIYAGQLYEEAPPLIIAFPTILSGLRIGFFQTQGILEKKQNQIRGRFTSRGAFFLWGSEDDRNGSIEGQFTLKVQQGKRTDLLGKPIPALW